LPTDSTSTFIRYVPNPWGFGRHHGTLASPMNSIVQAYRYGGIQGYYDVVRQSRGSTE